MTDAPGSEPASRGGAPTAAALLAAVGRRRARHALFGHAEAPVRLSRFVLEDVLGTGAMGVVFEASDPDLDRKVAVKVLEPGEADPEAVLAEASLLASISDPHVVPVFEVGRVEGLAYVVVERIAGRPLDRWVAEARARGADDRQVLSVLLGAARGLLACHRRGIVHRDLKPANVLVGDGDGRARVVDFGLALRSGEGRVGKPAGTPRYMAPEQRRTGEASTRSDVWALAALVVESLVGAPDGRRGTLSSSGDEPREPATAPDWGAAARAVRLGPLRGVVGTALSTDPAQRPENAGPLVDALEAALRPNDRPRRGVLATSGLVAVTVAVAFAAATYATRPDPRFAGVSISPTPVAGAPRILWVDDNPRYNREEIAHLRELGFAVELALTAEEASAAGAFAEYALVLSDMERQNERAYDASAGLTLIGAVRESGADTPVVIYTSERLVPVLRPVVFEAGGAGVAGTPEALYDLVDRTLRRD